MQLWEQRSGLPQLLTHQSWHPSRSWQAEGLPRFTTTFQHTWGSSIFGTLQFLLYFCTHIRNFAKISSSLTALTKRKPLERRPPSPWGHKTLPRTSKPLIVDYTQKFQFHLWCQPQWWQEIRRNGSHPHPNKQTRPPQYHGLYQLEATGTWEKLKPLPTCHAGCQLGNGSGAGSSLSSPITNH